MKTEFKKQFNDFIVQNKIYEAIVFTEKTIKIEDGVFFNTLNLYKNQYGRIKQDERIFNTTITTNESLRIQFNILVYSIQEFVLDTLKREDFTVALDKNFDPLSIEEKISENEIGDELWNVLTNIKREIFENKELSDKYQLMITDFENILKFHTGMESEKLSNINSLLVNNTEYISKDKDTNGRNTVVRTCDKMVNGKPSGEVVIKILKPDFYFNSLVKERFLENINYQKKLKHAGILVVKSETLLDQKNKSYFFEFESFKDKDLRDFVLNNSDNTSSYYDRIHNIVKKAAEAVKYLHKEASDDLLCAHCDVCPSNILLDFEKNKVVLGDFGSALIVKRKYTRYQLSEIGTTPYYPLDLKVNEFWADKTSEEQLLEAKKGDVFALAATLYFCLIKKEISSREFLNNLQKYGWKEEISKLEQNEKVRSFLIDCLDTKKISTIDEFYKQFINLNLEKIKKRKRIFIEEFIRKNNFFLILLALGTLIAGFSFKWQNETIEKITGEFNELETTLKSYLRWYAPFEEDTLRNELEFLFGNDSSLFNKNICKWVDLIVNENTHINERKYYDNSAMTLIQDIDLNEQIKRSAKDSFGVYPYDPQRVIWTNFSKTINNEQALKIDSLANKMFYTIAEDLVTSNRTAPSGEFFLNNIIGIQDTSYLSTLFYVYFEDENNHKLMMRYPAYTIDTIIKYEPRYRQWFLEATEEKGKRPNNLYLEQKYTPQKNKFSIGITKPYVTVRSRLPNKRTIWVNITPKGSAHTTILLNIDLIKKGKYIGLHN